MTAEQHKTTQFEKLILPQNEFPISSGLEVVFGPPNLAKSLIVSTCNGKIENLIVSGPPQQGKSTFLEELNRGVRLYSQSRQTYRKEPLSPLILWYDAARRDVLSSSHWRNYAEQEYQNDNPDWALIAFMRIKSDGLEAYFRQEVNQRIIDNYGHMLANSLKPAFRSTPKWQEIPLIGSVGLGTNYVAELKSQFEKLYVVAIVPDIFEGELSPVQERACKIAEEILSTPEECVLEKALNMGITITDLGVPMSPNELSLEQQKAVGLRVKNAYRWFAPRQRVIDLNKDIINSSKNISKWVLNRISQQRSLVKISDEHLTNPFVLHMMHVLLARSYENGLGLSQNKIAVAINKQQNSISTTFDLTFRGSV